jgi:glycine/D-amino acid oxidase-like deaminating enzyme
MSGSTADVVICGAGIAGISAAYSLTVDHGIKNVVLVDEREPMSLTSDKSTECYRNWWPGPDDNMVRFMNRSIDLLESLAARSKNYFDLNRRGYVFLTANPERADQFKHSAEVISALGAGPLRIYPGHQTGTPYSPSPAHGFADQLTGADLVLDPETIQTHYPFINDQAIAMLHTRRCGWLSAQQLGAYLFQNARENGARLIKGRVSGVQVKSQQVTAVYVEDQTGSELIQTQVFINAAGPFINQVGAMIDVKLPLINELHGKVALRDPLEVIPRHVPLMIWEDPVHLVWSDQDRKELAKNQETRWLVEKFPSGVHFRPEGTEGSQILLAIWTYDVEAHEVEIPPKFPPEYAEIILRGLVNMVPGLNVYLDRMPQPYIDGGYYCKTKENRPLIGRLPVEGAYVYGAISGFGIMAGMAGGELLAAHVTGSQLPDYAPAFELSRYEDPVYRNILTEMEASSGQL